jgi:branched-subunit amino acid ABC-type transport system permease component
LGLIGRHGDLARPEAIGEPATVQRLRVIVTVGLALVSLAGCALLRDEDMVALCRSLIPVFNAPGTTIDVRQTDASREPYGTGITVTYTATAPGAAPLRRAMSCIITRARTDAARLSLIAAATEDGPLGDIRLHILREMWIKRRFAVVSDPAPLLLVGPLPEVPARFGYGAQVALAVMPAIGIYALLAAAYALVYGLIGRINLAFGELAMLAGYGTWLGVALAAGTVGPAVGLTVGLAMGVMTAAVHGFALGRLVFQPLLDRSGQHVLVATVGMALVWSEALRLLQGSGPRWMSPVWTRPLGILKAGDMTITITPLTLLVPAPAALALAVALIILSRTRFGRQWRAVADDPLAAELLGVSKRATLARTLVLAGTLTGLAGALTVVLYGGVGSGHGLVVGLKALIAAIIGGIGSVPGAIAGAVLVGTAEAVWSAAFPIEHRDIALFAALIAAVVWRPEGLWRRSA